MAIAKLNKRRVTAGIAAATLLTMSLISGTLAKYTSTGNSWDKARVAKWGIEVTTVGDLYGDAYLASSQGATSAGDNAGEIGKWVSVDEGDKLTVKAEAKGVKVLAPGTNNLIGATLGLGGTAEVDAEVNVMEFGGQDIYMDAPATGYSYARATKFNPTNGAPISAASTDGQSVWAVCIEDDEASSPKHYAGDVFKVTTQFADIEHYNYYIAKDVEKIGRADFGEELDVDGNVTTPAQNYYPVQYFLGDDTDTAYKLSDEDIKDAVTASLAGKTYQAGEVIAPTDAVKLTWRWNFEQKVDNTDLTTNPGAAGNMNKVDTMFGELAMGGEDVIYLLCGDATGSIIKTNGDGFVFAGGEAFGSIMTGFNAQIQATQIN